MNNENSNPTDLSMNNRTETIKNFADFKIAIPIALAFALIFYILQKIGLVNLIGSEGMNLGTAFIIGIIASLSSCMAMVGGLLLSMSATLSKDGERARPQILFHSGRLISFFILGGIIGMIGSAFTLNLTMTFILSLAVGLVMLILGLNLLEVFSWTERLQPRMPEFISKHAMGISKWSHNLTPLLFGIATFFLPCGFTQSMQIYTLSTGNFLTGALTMLAFALGTFPVLAIISFSSMNIKSSKHSGVFFKTAGLIVIMFAILNILGALIILGVIPPILNF